jgi:hypothetical protein
VLAWENCGTYCYYDWIPKKLEPEEAYIEGDASGKNYELA